MTGWLIAILILFLLAVLPIGVLIIYNEQGALLRLILGPVRITLFPKNRKKEKKSVESKSKNKTQPSKKRQTQEKKPSKQGGKFSDFLPLVKLAISFLGDFRRKLRVDRLEMKLVMAGGDPCDLAINYGKAWIALGNLMPYLERIFFIRKRDLQVACDFVEEHTKIYARLDISITFGRLVVLAVNYGWKALSAYLKIMKKRKGGAVL